MICPTNVECLYRLSEIHTIFQQEATQRAGFVVRTLRAHAMTGQHLTEQSGNPHQAVGLGKLRLLLMFIVVIAFHVKPVAAVAASYEVRNG